MKRKNFSLETFKVNRCIIGALKVKVSLVDMFLIKETEIKQLCLRNTNAIQTEVKNCKIRNGKWSQVDLSHTEMEQCQIEGLTINGYNISELIETHKASSITDDTLK